MGRLDRLARLGRQLVESNLLRQLLVRLEVHV
jgi:hypothetical protein